MPKNVFLQEGNCKHSLKPFKIWCLLKSNSVQIFKMVYFQTNTKCSKQSQLSCNKIPSVSADYSLINSPSKKSCIDQWDGHYNKDISCTRKHYQEGSHIEGTTGLLSVKIVHSLRCSSYNSRGIISLSLNPILPWAK